ncbi:hypothetical protein [Nocardia sp. NPDC050406]|uniref:hypothetical protein n=1 Tax=Nocardia sp. NPDC050406 TaxID=3364318 RepID=UPI0037963BA6
MGRNRAAWLLVAASVAGGCAVGGDPRPTPGPLDSVVRETTAPGPTTSRSATDPLPLCGEIGSGTTPRDCRLQSHDAVGVTFEVRRGAASTITIDVLADGARVQTLTERDVRHPSDPSLRDVDGDGRDELLVPIQLATANTRFAVYRATESATEFHRSGELTGVGIDTTEDGYVVTPARVDYASWDIAFLRFTDDTLDPVVTAQVRLLPSEGGAPPVSECTLVDAGGLHSTGLTSLEAARERFCAEPSVQRVMRR